MTNGYVRKVPVKKRGVHYQVSARGSSSVSPVLELTSKARKKKKRATGPQKGGEKKKKQERAGEGC